MGAASARKPNMSESPPTDISNQENVSARSTVAKQASKQQVRHRASVACASCRERRIRCVVPKGDNECTQCKRTGTECVIKNDDERRRPISKAYMSSLSERINMLEGLLLDKGVVPPPPAHPPKTRHDSGSKRDDDIKDDECTSTKRRFLAQDGAESPLPEVPSPPDSANDDFAMQDSDQADSITLPTMMDFQPQSVRNQTSFRLSDQKQENLVHRLLTTKGNLSFDQISGRLRFFGPTANPHVYAESADKSDSREPPEQVRRAERIIRSLTTATYDYLMNLFWEYYNGVLVVIDQDAFESDRDSQNPKFYSSFLHITILAMAYRFADKDREDMIKITLGNRECTLHREAKYMLDIELERPGGIPSVQALLLLGDLECGVGRDNTGWMYAGMANRLAFDIGLHLDCSTNGLSDKEVSIRHMVMRACVIFDKYWALFLGRPTSIKNSDIGMDLLSRRFSSMLSGSSCGAASGSPLKKPLTSEIYDQLVELMELAGRIVEVRENNRVSTSLDDQNNMFAMNEAEDNAYLHVINLDRQLQNWYRRLPENLTWKPANIKTAPYSFFLLHQQYHVSMILLHRPWAKYRSMSDDASTNSHPSPENAGNVLETRDQQNLSMTGHALGLGDPTSIVDDSRASLSRNICTQQAIRVSRIFWQHRQRFNGKKIFVTGIQHAGTAAIALIAALAYQQTEQDRRSHLGYLECLSLAINDMSESYHPAARMDALMQAVIHQLRQDLHDPHHTRNNSFAQPSSGSVGATGPAALAASLYSILPARRENSDADSAPTRKRLRPTASRRASEFARPPPPFYTQPTPPGSSESHHPLASELHMTGVYPGFGDNSAPYLLESLRDSAIEIDSADESGQPRPSEDFVMTANGPETWGMHGSSHPEPQLSHEYGFQMSDWISSGPAGLSASSVLTQPTPTGGALGLEEFSTSAKSDSMARPGQTLSSSLGRSVAAGDKGEGSLDWMGSEGGINALSPVSLEGLVNSVEKAAGAETDASNPAPRNHELDFFSF